jgi:hypothetical protein
MPFAKAEASRSINITEVVPWDWWVLATVLGGVGVILAAGIIIYREVTGRA